MSETVARLSRTQTILHLAAEDLVEAQFYEDLEGEPGVERTASLSWEDFHAMGNPKTITVTIDPGDILNSKDSD